MTVTSIVCIVEGHGEAEAVPILLRRIGRELAPPRFFSIHSAIRVPASKLLQEGELERKVDVAARKIGPDGAIFVLLDCDDGCPAQLGPDLLRRARAARPDRRIAVVLAKREYEAWFLASARSLQGKRGLPEDLEPPPDPESIRGAKEWLSRQMGPQTRYSETTDQPALTALFDMQAARAADSFDKCYRELTALLTDPDPPPQEG